jgi:GT2 family glycosyltransferase
MILPNKANLSNRLVSAIIVTTGKAGHIGPCVESVRAQTYPAVEIIIIDNSADIDFGRLLNRRYPFVRVYSNPDNLFYCQALNKGIEISSGDLILCLNDDVTLEKNFIEEASRGFAIYGKIGMVSGKILRTDRNTIDSAGLFLTPWRTAKERGYGRADAGQFERQRHVFGVSGAAAFYRKEMLEDIKQGGEYFDAGFRMFYEDLDVAWRAQNLGWRGFYMPGAIAYHVRGATGRRAGGIDKKYARLYLSDELNLHLIKNRHMAVLKNESWVGLVFHLPCILLYDAAELIYIIFFRPRIIKMLLLNLNLLKSALKKRRPISA